MSYLHCLLFLRRAKPPVRIAIIGLVHTHVRGFLPQALTKQTCRWLASWSRIRHWSRKLVQRYQLNTNLFYASLEELLAKTNVQAVAMFTSTFDHGAWWKRARRAGIHVMMEKPLAVNMEHARAMAAAAKKGGMQLLVNYETTWYPANQAAYKLVCERACDRGLAQVRGS